MSQAWPQWIVLGFLTASLLANLVGAARDPRPLMRGTCKFSAAIVLGLLWLLLVGGFFDVLRVR